MTEQTAESQKQRRSRKATAIGCSSLLVLGSALGVTAFLLLTPVPPPDADLRVLPNPNGYDGVKGAVQVLTPSLQNSPLLDKQASAAALREALEPDVQALDRLHKALRLPYMSPPIKVSAADYTAMSMNFNAQVREGARKLTARSRLALAEGRYGESMDYALDTIELGVKVPRGGMIIDALVGHACIALGNSGTLSLVERLKPEELRSARRRVGDLLSQAVSEKDILTEERRVMLQDCRRTGLRDPGSRIFYWQMDQVYRQALKEAEKPSAQRLPPSSADAAFGRLVSSVLPDLRKSLDKRDRMLATLYMKLGIEEFRKTHSRLPENIEELVPGIFPEPPLDPPTQKPLKYRRFGSTYDISPP